MAWNEIRCENARRSRTGGIASAEKERDGEIQAIAIVQNRIRMNQAIGKSARSFGTIVVDARGNRGKARRRFLIAIELSSFSFFSDDSSVQAVRCARTSRASVCV